MIPKFFVGIDVAKVRNAIAIADGERGGEVQMSRTEATPVATSQSLPDEGEGGGCEGD